MFDERGAIRIIEGMNGNWTVVGDGGGIIGVASNDRELDAIMRRVDVDSVRIVTEPIGR